MSLPSFQTAAIINEFNVNPDCFTIDTQFPLPKIEEDDILVKNYFAGVNPLDCHLRKGANNWISSFPAVLGVDFSGVVEKIGDKVTKFKVGDSVSGCTFGGFRGTYSQYIVSSESQTAHNSPSISHQVATSGAVLLTAYQAFLQYPSSKSGQKGSMKGKKVLFIGGSGGVGIFAILLAKHYFEAEQIVSISSSRNTELIKKLGVDYVLDYTQGKEYLSRELQQLSGSFDLVVDLVGGYQDYYGIEILKNDEESLFVSIVHSVPVGGGKVFGSTRNFALYADPSGEQYEQVLNWLGESGLWKEVPLHIIKLEDVAQAHKMSETKRTVGRIVLEIPHSD